MPRTLVFCADGTWNSPTQDPDQDLGADPTHVFRLFRNLAGAALPGGPEDGREAEKVLEGPGGVRQAAKYLHGVGDSRNPILRLLGGAFGAGTLSRIVRGWTFLSRHHAPGAAIVITGFSRGAYTARALAALVASRGLLHPDLTRDREEAYRLGAQAWFQHRRAVLRGPGLAHLAELAGTLPALLSPRPLGEADLVPVARIAAVGVWDTVGALGLPAYAGGGGRLDAFRFADTALSPKVAAGFHAVARDEERSDFSPTLWDPAPGVTQVLFPGAHGDVGGGYPDDGGPGCLADGALAWMMACLGGAGAVFQDPLPCPPAPDPAATAHRPWRHAPWALLPHGRRSFPADLAEDPSVQARREAGLVRPDPGAAAEPYR